VRESVLRTLPEMAKTESGPFCKLALSCMKVDVRNYPRFEKLEDVIKAAGHKIDYKEKENITICTVKGKGGHIRSDDNGNEVFHENPEALLAHGVDVDKDEALLQALLGAMREEIARAEVAKALADKGHKVNQELRQELESRFIQKGGHERLKADMETLDAAKPVS